MRSGRHAVSRSGWRRRADTVVDGNRITLTLTEQALRERKTAAVNQSIEIVRRRIDETGVREPTIQRQGSERILVQLPGVKDPERVKRLLGKTAKMNFRLVDLSMSARQAAQGRPPPGSELLEADNEFDADGSPVKYLVRKRVMVSGDTLVDAQPTVQDAQPVVSFRFDAVGGRRFGDTTRRNVGRPFAIVLDGKVISAPVIREPILGGTGIISGNFTVQSARDLALLLRAGALPAPLTVLEERTVGPGLGADSIRAGKIASVLAVVLVVVFMAGIYGRFGLMADVALLMNLILITALLSLLQATLTLPGIAGIVLTIGMAVDANVLIFERIREEQRNGRTPDVGDRCGLPAGADDDHRCQPDDVHRRGVVVPVRLRADQGVRGHARAGADDLDVHRDHAHPVDGRHLAAPHAAPDPADLTGRGHASAQPCSDRHRDRLHAPPQTGRGRIDRARAGLGAVVPDPGAELRHRFPRRHSRGDPHPGPGRDRRAALRPLRPRPSARSSCRSSAKKPTS